MRIQLDGRAAPVLAPEPLVLLWRFSDSESLSGLNAAIDRQTGGVLKQQLVCSGWQAGPGSKFLCAGATASLLLMGLGSSAACDVAVFAQALTSALQALDKLNQTVFSMTLPEIRPSCATAAHLLAILAAWPTALEVRLICAPADLDNCLLGLQQTKVRLKRTTEIAIVVTA